jgi:hypothetical protein
MTIHVALLRAINLPAHKPVAMADLRDFFTKVGLGEPRTLLQTGNVVFRSSKRTGAGLSASSRPRPTSAFTSRPISSCAQCPTGARLLRGIPSQTKRRPIPHIWS